MKRILLVSIGLLLALAASAQRTNVREEVLNDWNKSSGLDCVYDQSPKAATPAPKGYEAVYIGHYGRHGSRYAYTARAYTVLLEMLARGQKEGNLTPYGEKLLADLQPFWDIVRYRVGDLTPLGWQQHQYIARTMVKSFPTVFGKGSKVDACSSASERSMLSMSSCCAELSRVAPKTEIYAHQSILDMNATRPNDKNNPFRYEGPATRFPYAESPEAFFLRKFPQYRTVLGRLFKDPDAGLASYTPWNAFFNIYMFIAGMNSIPEEERLDVSGLVTKEEYAILWETDNYDRFREYIKYRTPNSSVVEDIVRKADEALASGQRGAHLRFGHDHVLMSLLMVMDIDGFDTVPENNDELVYWFQSFRSPKATNLQFVFYKPKKKGGDVLVKLLLNGEEAHFGRLEGFPYYKWADVRSYLLSRVAKFAYRPADGQWTVTEVTPGLNYMEFRGLEPVTGSAQQIFVADCDLTQPGFSFRYATSGEDVGVASDVLRKYDALVSMNAAYERTSVVVKVDGELLSNMPYNTVMTSPVPNWKSEAAIYTSADGRTVEIAYEGKGRSLSELRQLYAASSWPNIYTSAPMLIADHQPVGASFAGFHTAAEIAKLNYEDPVRHQGVRHPRTAVALTDNGHLLMVVVDGRRPGVSEGMSARELTLFLEENFHPKDAINMDGGGSSTLCVAGQGDPSTHVVNYPVDNKRYDHTGERHVSTYFYLVKE